MVDLTEEAREEADGLLASLMLCETHANAFGAPLTWTFVDNRSFNRKQGTALASVLDLAHNDDRQESLEQGNPESGRSEPGSRQEPGEKFDMEDTPLLQRAFRSISS